MPVPTQKLKIPKPLGNEPVSRAAFDEIWETIDRNAAAQEQVDMPFYLRDVSYDAQNNRLVLTIGPGRAAFGATRVLQTGDATYYINAPAPNTSYYLFLRSDGSFAHKTQVTEGQGEALLWQIQTGAQVSSVTVTDLRGQLPAAAARAVQDALDAHRQAATLDHPDGSVTDAKLGNRTINDSSAPSSNAGPLTTLLGWIANRIRAITGGASWRDDPPITLAAAKAHIDAAAPHSGHETPAGAQAKVDAHNQASTGVHGVGNARVAKTSRPDQWPSWNDIPDKPTTFPPAAHQHAGSDIVSPVAQASYADNAGNLGGVPASSYARKDQANSWSQKQTFQAGIQIGDADTDLTDLYGLVLPRSALRITVSQWDSTHSHLPKRLEIRTQDGQTLIGYIDFTYNSEGRCTQAVATVGSWSRPWNASWSSGKSWPNSIT